MQDFKAAVANCLKSKIEDLSYDEILQLIEIPPNKDMGDYAFPCFKLAKVFRKAPNLIAQDIAESITPEGDISKVAPMGGYVNFFVNKSQLAKTVINNVLTQKDDYGKSKIGEGKNIIVEFSSPNIAKPFHIGHIRTTVIGNAIYKLYASQGYNTIRINHLGDYGTQFGKLIVAFKKWGDKETVEKNPIKELLALYIKFHDVAKEQPELEEEARAWFVKLESGDEEAKALWTWFREESLKEFDRVYKLMDIEFDSFAGESFYTDKMDSVIKDLEDKNLLKESRGAKIVDLEEYGMPPALIQKNDGSTLYMTRDLAAAIYRKNTYNFDKCIYVVASQQNLHFQQWFKVIELMGYDWYDKLEHVNFGMVSLEGGTLSTRNGRVVFLEDVFNQAIQKTREIIESKNPDIENLEKTVKDVGVGAVIFQELSNSRIKDYVFTWDKTLSFDGETGPYVQYTHTRCCSVLRKAGEEVTADINYDLISDENSSEVLKLIGDFNKNILLALRKSEPHIITRFVLDLAQGFNKFYHDNPILVDDAELRKARLALVEATRQTIQNALALLGIHAPERM